MSTANMIERRWLADWPSIDAMQRDLYEALEARGATYARLSFKEASKELVGEGWYERPDDQGELPM